MKVLQKFIYLYVYQYIAVAITS